MYGDTELQECLHVVVVCVCLEKTDGKTGIEEDGKGKSSQSNKL